MNDSNVISLFWYRRRSPKPKPLTTDQKIELAFKKQREKKASKHVNLE